MNLKWQTNYTQPPVFVASYPAKLYRKKSAGNKADNVLRTLRNVRATIVTVEKQRVLHMLRAYSILSYVACPALEYFSAISYKRHDFRKALLNIKYVF